MSQHAWRDVNKTGVVIFSRPSEGPYEIALNKGDRVRIKAECVGWCKVHYLEKENFSRGTKEQRGIFPSNYIAVDGEEMKFEKQDREKYEKVRKIATPSEVRTNADDLLAREIIQVLHEWGSEVIKLRSEKRKRDYMEVKKQMATLIGLRKTVTDQRWRDTADKKQKDEVAERVIKVIEEGSRQLNLDLIVRVSKGVEKGQRANENNTGIIDLFRQYQSVQQSEEGVRRKRKIKEDLKALSDSKLSEEEIESKRTELLSRMIKGYDPQNKLQQVRELYDLPDGYIHFLLDVKACLFTVGESVEIFFSLYNKSTKSTITEEFAVEITALGMPNDPRLIQNIKTLFANIPEKSYLADLYMVARIYRKGKMLLGNMDAAISMSEVRQQQMSTGGGGVATDIEEENYYRRPFGCAVLPLTPQVISERLMDGKEYTPGNLSVFYSRDESNFPNLHEMIIAGSGNFERLPTTRAIGIAVGITLFQKPIEQVLEDEKETLDLTKTVCLTNLLEFPEIISPGEQRSDLYITVDSGVFGSEFKNVKVTARVISKETGAAALKCINRSTCLFREPDMYYHSSIYYNTSTPVWDETFCIKLPAQQLEESTIVFTFSSENKKKKLEKFAVGFFQLQDEATGVIKGEPKYTIDLFKYVKDMEKSYDNYAVGTITKLQPVKDTFTLGLKLVSTQATQEAHLNNLLKWETAKMPLSTILYEFTFVLMPKIAQHSKPVFNALFEIIAKKQEPLTYGTFLHIVDLLSKKQFLVYRSVIDDYIDHYFKFSEEQIHRFLLDCLSTNLDNEAKTGKEVSQSLKAFHYMFRFIVMSRLYCVNAGQQVITTENFVQQCVTVFEKLNKVIAIDSTTLVAAQDLALKFIPHLFESIADIFPSGNDSILGEITTKFIRAIPNTGRKNTIDGKLAILNAVAHGSLLESPVRRAAIIPVLVEQVKTHIHVSSSERKACVKVIASIMGTLQRQIVDKKEELKDMTKDYDQMIQLLPNLNQAFDELLTERNEIRVKIERSMSSEGGKQDNIEIFALNEEIKRVSDTSSELFSSLLVLFSQMTYGQLKQFATSQSIVSILDILKLMIEENPIPEYWIQYNVFSYKVIYNTVEFVSKFMSETYMGKNFSKEIWNRFFDVCIRFTKCSRLQIEKFSMSKQAKVTVHGDLRVLMTGLLRTAWDSLSPDQQYSFVPDLVNPILRIAALIPQKEIYVNMLNVYCSLVEREFKATKSLKQCQGLTAVILDEYIATDVIDDKFKDYLVDVLSSRFQQNSEMITEGTKFLTETKTLIELIQSVKRFNDTQEDQKTSALMRVMQYVFAADQQQIFLKYLLKLADVHAVNANYIEAGLTLLLHANKLTWSNDKILPALSTEFPEESERARKEKLYNKAIVYFDKGKDWERAIGLIRELSPIYEHETGEYKKLAAVLRQMGEFFEKINDSKRFFASYFYVAYYGKGFDDWGLRNNQYIYRGNEAERLMDFVERIMKRFPNAEMLKPMAPVTDEVLNGDGQYIQLMTVYPVEFGDIKTKCSPKDRNENISMNIAGYSQANKVKVFNYFRTYRMHPKDKEMNEISDLYTNITFLIIGKENTDIDTDDFLATNSFPTIVRRKRVIDTVEVILSPIENAVKNIEDKNTEIMELVISHRLDAKPDTGKLSMQLNGTIDAAVMGGVGKYLSAFFNKEFVLANPKSVGALQRLQRALAQQLVVLEKGLHMYRTFGTAATKKHVEHLSQMFRNMQQQLAEPIQHDFAQYLQ